MCCVCMCVLYLVLPHNRVRFFGVDSRRHDGEFFCYDHDIFEERVGVSVHKFARLFGNHSKEPVFIIDDGEAGVEVTFLSALLFKHAVVVCVSEGYWFVNHASVVDLSPDPSDICSLLFRCKKTVDHAHSAHLCHSEGSVPLRYRVHRCTHNPPSFERVVARDEAAQHHIVGVKFYRSVGQGNFVEGKSSLRGVSGQERFEVRIQFHSFRVNVCEAVRELRFCFTLGRDAA